MSEHHGGHHGGDMGGGFSGPPDPPRAPDGFDPVGMEQHDQFRDSRTFSTYRRGGRAGFRYRPRRGSPGWVVLWIVRLAVIALFVYVALHIASGMGSSGP